MIWSVMHILLQYLKYYNIYRADQVAQFFPGCYSVLKLIVLIEKFLNTLVNWEAALIFFNENKKLLYQTRVMKRKIGNSDSNRSCRSEMLGTSQTSRWIACALIRSGNQTLKLEIGTLQPFHDSQKFKQTLRREFCANRWHEPYNYF